MVSEAKFWNILVFLDAHLSHVVAVQETKIDSTITASKLFPETCMYSVYRKDRNTHGVGLISLTCQSWNWKITLDQFG